MANVEAPFFVPEDPTLKYSSTLSTSRPLCMCVCVCMCVCICVCVHAYVYVREWLGGEQMSTINVEIRLVLQEALQYKYILKVHDHRFSLY